MLRKTLSKGDAVTVTYPDGITFVIEVQSRSELAFHFPKEIRIQMERRRFQLIDDNQK